MDYYDGAVENKVDDMLYFDVRVPSVVEVWESCMKSSIVQIVQYVAAFFLWNVAFRVIYDIHLPRIEIFTDETYEYFPISIAIALRERHKSWHTA